MKMPASPSAKLAVMVVRSAFFLTVALLALAGCGGESDAATLKQALSYARTGGFVGVGDHLSVQPGGQAKVTTRKGGTKSFTLSKSERKALTDAVSAADLTHVKVTSGLDAPDAYSYVIRYGAHKLAFNDANMPKDVKKLVTELNKLVAKHAT
jgi:hypothetical protein